MEKKKQDQMNEGLFNVIESIPANLPEYAEFIHIREFEFLFNQLGIPHHGLDNGFIYSLCYNGFFPFGNGDSIMPKLHQTRCCIILDKWFNQHSLKHKENSNSFKIENQKLLMKKIKKAGKKIYRHNYNKEFFYYLEINQNNKEVFEFTKDYHGYSFWIKRKFFEKLNDLSKKPLTYKDSQFQTLFISLIKKDKNGKRSILATDIGYITGSIYTSMTGAYNDDYSNFGNILLFVLPFFFKSKNLKIMDFGMIINYKLEMGGERFLRKDFLNLVKEHRDNKVDLSNLIGSYKIEDISDFWNIIEFINNFKKIYLNERKMFKMKRKLNPELRKIEKEVKFENWTCDFIQKWLQIKFGILLKEEDFVEENFFQIDSSFFKTLSKKKRKKVFKIINKLKNKK